MIGMPDPLNDDPPGTRDERTSENLPTWRVGDRQFAGLCHIPRCQGGVKPVTPPAHDGSRRFECNDPDCDYKARRNWAYYESS